MSRGLESGRIVGRRVRLLALGAVCLGALGLAPGAAAGDRVVEQAEAAQCGPCPVVVFAKGSGAGRISPDVRGGSGQGETSCEMAPRGECSFYIDEFATTAFLIPQGLAGATFLGWEGCPRAERPGDRACEINPGEALALCARFGTPGEAIPPSDCPPPSIQVYKKANGLGTVTASGASGVETCDDRCPLKVMTRYLPNEAVRLTATAAAGSTFVRWDGCPDAQGNVCNVTLIRGVVLCSVFVKTGSAAPAAQQCPYTTPPIVPVPRPKPPGLGSRCTIPGSPFAETIRAGGRNDVICARGGNDRAYGRAGHDLIRAGGGHDRAYGGSGYDRLRGDAGNDRLYAGSGQDIVEGGSGNDVSYTRDGARDVVRCGRGRDVVYADRADRVARDCEVVRRTRR